jgi:hypothetical protein
MRYSPLWTGCLGWPGWLVRRNSCPGIDGVDASAFMLGKSDTTGRDSYMFFSVDAELMSIKWKICKTVFRYTEPHSIGKGFITPQFPMCYDLSSDPHEDNNLFETDMTNGWMLAPCFKLISEYQRSVKEYPNIKVGDDFKGYKKRITKAA